MRRCCPARTASWSASPCATLERTWPSRCSSTVVAVRSGVPGGVGCLPALLVGVPGQVSGVGRLACGRPPGGGFEPVRHRCRDVAFGAQLVGVLGQEPGGVGGGDQAGAAPLALQPVQRLRVDARGEVGHLAAHGRVQVVEHSAAGAEGPAVSAGAQTGRLAPGMRPGLGPRLVLSARSQTPYAAARIASAGARPSPRNRS